MPCLRCQPSPALGHVAGHPADRAVGLVGEDEGVLRQVTPQQRPAPLLLGRPQVGQHSQGQVVERHQPLGMGLGRLLDELLADLGHRPRDHQLLALEGHIGPTQGHQLAPTDPRERGHPGRGPEGLVRLAGGGQQLLDLLDGRRGDLAAVLPRRPSPIGGVLGDELPTHPRVEDGPDHGMDPLHRRRAETIVDEGDVEAVEVDRPDLLEPASSHGRQHTLVEEAAVPVGGADLPARRAVSIPALGELGEGDRTVDVGHLVLQLDDQPGPFLLGRSVGAAERPRPLLATALQVEPDVDPDLPHSGSKFPDAVALSAPRAAHPGRLHPD